MIKLEKLLLALDGYNITLSDKQKEQFTIFENFLKEYNLHTNLVSARDIELVWEKHFVDSVAFCHYLKNDKELQIIDIGSGGGFPVIPEAIILTKSKITALDSTAKKTTFLSMAADKIGVKNFSAINDRAEEISHRKSYREKFDIVTARAVGNLAQITELALPFLKIGGYFIAYKSAKFEEELNFARNTLKILGGEVKDIFEYKLELDENYARNIILIEKIAPSPAIYPRSYSTIKNKPLWSYI